jgi:hypothetical protein
MIFDEANHVYPFNAARPAVSGRINGHRQPSRYGKSLVALLRNDTYVSRPIVPQLVNVAWALMSRPSRSMPSPRSLPAFFGPCGEKRQSNPATCPRPLFSARTGLSAAGQLRCVPPPWRPEPYRDG